MPAGKISHQPQHIVDHILANNVTFHNNLVWVREWKIFFLYKDGHYCKLEKETFEEILIPVIREEFPDLSITVNLLSNLFVLFARMTPLRVDEIISNHLSFTDVNFNLETWQAEPHDRDHLCIHFYKFPFESEKYNWVDMPNFKRFLETTIVLEDGVTPDPSTLDLVQEMFGYYLSSNLKGRMSFFLYGSGHNGKSQICDLVMHMIGRRFCEAMTIERLTTNQFASSRLISKKLNICNEESSNFIDSAMFKTLVSGEMITAERKGQDSFSFFPRTKFLFATNKLPTFKNFDRAIMDRIIIIPLYADFKRAQKHLKDPDILSKLLPEIRHIVKWSMEGLRRLMLRGYEFKQSNEAIKCGYRYEKENSSALAFIQDNFRIHNADTHKDFITAEDLYQMYRQWCEQNGRKPMNSNNFFQDGILANVVGSRQYVNDGLRKVRKRGYLMHYLTSDEKDQAEDDQISKLIP